MLLYWLTLLMGIILIIVSLIKVNREKEDEVSNNKASSAPNKNKSSQLGKNSNYLIAEIIEELHENTEKIVERYSKREKKMEMLLEQADKKIDELNYQLKNYSTPQIIEYDEKKQASYYINNEKKEDYGNILPFPSYDEKYSQVKNLFNKGYNVTEIARETGKKKGEVQLILKLIQKSEELNNEGMGF